MFAKRNSRIFLYAHYIAERRLSFSKHYMACHHHNNVKDITVIQTPIVEKFVTLLLIADDPPTTLLPSLEGFPSSFAISPRASVSVVSVRGAVVGDESLASTAPSGEVAAEGGDVDRDDVAVGSILGCTVVGESLGKTEGTSVGALLGPPVGCWLGSTLGEIEGLELGDLVAVGVVVGDVDGVGLGSGVEIT